MPTQIQRRRGTTAQHSAFTGANGELTVDTDKEVVVVHDGATAGGYPQMRENGSQNLVTTGSITGGRFIPTSSTAPTNGVYLPAANNVAISTNGTGRLFVDSSGRVGVASATPSSYSSGFNQLVVGSSSDQGITIVSGTSSSATLAFADGTTGADAYRGFVQYSHANNALLLGTDGTERARIDSSGRLGLGTSSPSVTLHVSDSSSTANGTVRLGGGSGFGGYYSTIQQDALTTGKLLINSVAAAGTSHGIQLQVDGTSALAIDASRRVGIGFTGPEAALHAGGTSSSPVILAGADSGDVAYKFRQSRGTITSPTGTGTEGVKLSFEKHTGSAWASPIAEIYAAGSGSGADGYLAFLTKPSGGSATERGRWTSDGKFLVGTSSDSLGSTIIAQGNSSDSSGVGIMRACCGTASPANGAELGALTFGDSGHVGSVAIIGLRDGGTWSGSSKPSRLTFSTCPDSSATPVERMRITNQGRTFINKTTTSSTNSPGLEIQAPNTNLAEFALEIRDSTGADIIIGCSNGNYLRSTTVYGRTSAAAANVIIDPGGYIYRSTSSIKYKTDIETLDDSYADALLNCRPVWYRSTSERDNPQWGHWGFIAEEVAEIDPRLCFFSEKEDGSLEPEGVQYDRFVPHLLNLIKRQKEQIEAQGTAIAALEARLSALEAS